MKIKRLEIRKREESSCFSQLFFDDAKIGLTIGDGDPESRTWRSLETYCTAMRERNAELEANAADFNWIEENADSVQIVKHPDGEEYDKRYAVWFLPDNGTERGRGSSLHLAIADWKRKNLPKLKHRPKPTVDELLKEARLELTYRLTDARRHELVADIDTFLAREKGDSHAD